MGGPRQDVDLTARLPSVAYLEMEGPHVDGLLEQMRTHPPLVALALAAPLMIVQPDASTHRREVSMRARAVASDHLAHLSSRCLVNVDQQLRSVELLYHLPFAWAWAQLPREVAQAQPRQLTTDAFLSMHPSGYIRGDALERLAVHGDGALPWLLLRTRDWVPAVRARALALTLAHIDAATVSALIDALPLVHRFASDTRDRSLIDRFYVRLAPQAAAVVERASSFDHETLDGVLDELAMRQRLTVSHCERLLDATVPPSVRLRAARALAALSEGSVQLSSPRVTAMLADRLAGIRDAALRVAVRLDADPRGVLDTALLDPNRGVRWTALDLSRELGPFDAEAFYRAHLGTTSAILGFADVSPTEAWEALVPFLDGSPKEAAAALRAMKRMARVESRELRLYMLGDERTSVSRAAFQTLRGERLDESSLLEALRSPLAHTRANALALVLAQPEWAALRLLADAPREQTPRQREVIGEWLWRFVARRRWLPPIERAQLRTLTARFQITSHPAIAAELEAMDRGLAR